jgi:carbon-monoxide dehydrogenase large subunit
MSTTFPGRKEDERLLRGKGQFTDDWSLPHQAHAVFLRSDHAHAEITRLDVSAARAMPGVLGIYTQEDLEAAGLGTPPPFFRMKGIGDMEMRSPPRYLLAKGRVRYVGHPIAMVVAETQHQAQDALEQIEIDYQDLPSVNDVLKAMEPGAPQLYDEVPNNIAFECEWGDAAAVDKLFATAAHTVDVTIDNTRVITSPMEPSACIAYWNEGAKRFEVYRPTQGVNFTLMFMQGYFGPPREKYRFISKDVGGSFGTRAAAYPEHVGVMIAAKELGRPVKWTSTRSETMVSDTCGRSALTRGQLAFDNDGKFIAVRYQWKTDCGFYPLDLGPGGHIGNGLKGAVGPYKIQAAYARYHVVVTNAIGLGAYRGAGRPEIGMILEQLVDAAALKLGMDRFEIRNRNVITREEYPYTTPLQVVYDSGDHPGLAKIAAERGDWAGFPARKKEARARGKVRGIGCSTHLECSGAAFPKKEQSLISFLDDGKVVVDTIAGPNGQGTETTLAIVVSRELGVPYEDVIVRCSEPDAPVMTGLGTGGSRVAMTYGSALALGSREIIRKGQSMAAEELEVAAQDIEFKDGAYHVAGTDLQVKLTDLAKKNKGALDTMGEVEAPLNFPGGSHVCEVELDPDTGVIDLIKYVAVDDCGNLISHMLTEGQLYGGIVQGIGQVMGEKAHYDDNGQLLTASFMDYFMPRADMLPKIELVNHPVPTPTNVLGAKGVGETGSNGGLTCTYSAVMDALRQVGVTEMQMPFTPGRVWQAIQDAKQAKAAE